MGKGDKKSRRGKIWRGTSGVLRRPLENKHKPGSKTTTESEKSTQS